MVLKLTAGESADGQRPRIAVLGVGGAGTNAVNAMIRAGLEGVEFIVANTDVQALAGSPCENRIQLGRNTTGGLGAGSQPEVGRMAAEEVLEDLLDALEDFNLVFITAGMGGGTGTGGAPVIARAAREAGLLAISVATKPFDFEGPKRMRTAETGLQELQRYSDTLLVIPNQNLFRVVDRRTSLGEAFALADRVLQDGVRSVSDLILLPGLINLDFADVRVVIEDMGRALMGAGEAEGENRAIEAAAAAVGNPLLEGLPLDQVRALLINVTGGEDLTLHEVEQAVAHISERIDPSAELIFGSALDTGRSGRIRVSLVATGLNGTAPRSQSAARAAMLSLVSNRDHEALPQDPAEPQAEPAPAEPQPAPAPPIAGAGPSEPASEAAASPSPPAAEPPAPPPREERSAAPAPTAAETPEEPEDVLELTDPLDEAAETAAEPAEPGAAPQESGLIERLVSGLTVQPEDLFQKAERIYRRGEPKDLRLAFRIYLRAAKRGHAGAQNRLGWMLERGEGSEPDLMQAALWHRRAAEQGHLNGMNDLGYLYRQGRGVPQDYGQALYWFQLAADRDYGYAEFNIGQMYENGWGVERDLDQAVSWYRKAASRSHEWAGRRLRDLGMTP